MNPHPFDGEDPVVVAFNALAKAQLALENLTAQRNYWRNQALGVEQNV